MNGGGGGEGKAKDEAMQNAYKPLKKIARLNY